MLTDVHGRDDQADLLTRHGVTAQQVNDHMHLVAVDASLALAKVFSVAQSGRI
jgi:hypothetical protein